MNAGQHLWPLRLTGLLLYTGAASFGEATPVSRHCEPRSARPATGPESPRAAAADELDAVRSLLQAKKYAAAAAQLEGLVEASPEDPIVRELMGDALAGLRRNDEAAHHYDAALGLRLDEGKTPEVRALERRVLKVDPQADARRGFFGRALTLLSDVGQELIEQGDAERGAQCLERVVALASGDERARIEALIAKARAVVAEVDLDSTRVKGRNEFIERESEHYRIRAALEPETVEVVAKTMDAIYAYYVEIYLEGDWSKASFPKARITIHPTWNEMAALWAEQPPAGLGGWWNPAANEVHCYDTSDPTSPTGGMGSREFLLGTLFHESSHQFMHFLCLEGKGWSPAWLNEGTASFFEGARAMEDDSVLWPDAAVGRLRNLAQGIAGGGGLPVKDIVGFSAPGSYPGEFYAYGWGLIYYLQEYEDPQTLERPFRPLYDDYRTRITTSAQHLAPLPLFEEVFLGARSPLGHRTLDDFEQAWRRWILDDVRPLSLGNAQRGARLKKATECRAAAARFGPQDERQERMLVRALNHLTYVREEIDLAETPDPEILLAQAEVLRELGRPTNESLVLEKVLLLADEGDYELSDDEYDRHSKRLDAIDKENAGLRKARARARNHAKRAFSILADYAEEGFVLRAYTFAAEAAQVLGHKKLAAAAGRLKVEATAAGLLKGASRSLFHPDQSAWVSIFPPSTEKRFSQSPVQISIEGEGNAPAGRICKEIGLSGEYEVRATLGREGEMELGALHGVVFSANKDVEDGEWMICGIDYNGQLVVRSAAVNQGGLRGGLNVVFETWFDEDDEELETPVAPDEHPHLRIRVFPEGRIEVQVGERAPLEIELSVEMPARNYVGIFAVGGKATLTDAVVEEFL